MRDKIDIYCSKCGRRLDYPANKFMLRINSIYFKNDHFIQMYYQKRIHINPCKHCMWDAAGAGQQYQLQSSSRL